MRRLFAFADQSAEWLLGGLLLFSLLWRGGKSLDATWLLVGVGVIVTFGWWGNSRARQAERQPVIDPFLWGSLALFIAWTGLSYILSTTQNYGLDEVIRDASLALIFLWAARRNVLPDAAKLRSRFFGLLSVGVLIACLVGMGVYMLQPVDRFVGTFFDARFHTDYWPNAWADVLLLSWPLLLLHFRHLHFFFRILLLGLVASALFLSYSRGGMLAAGLQGTLLIFCMVWMERGVQPRKMVRRAAEICVAVALGVIMFLAANMIRSQFHPVQSVAEKLTFTAAEGRSSVDERQEFWGQAVALSLQRPLTGWGPYSFRFTQPRLQTGVLRTTDHPHNVFLKLAAERGWPAVIFFVGILLGVLYPVTRRIMRRQSTVEECVLLIAVVGVLAHSMIDYNLQFVGISLPFWIFLGLLVQHRQKPWNWNKRFVQVAELMLAIIIAVVAVAEGRYLVLSSLGRRAEAAGDTEKALSWYEQSVDEKFSRDLHLSRANIFIQKNELAAAEGALDDYLQQNTEDARAWVLLARVAMRYGEYAEVTHLLDQALERAPYNYIEPLIGLIVSLERTGPVRTLEIRREEWERLFRLYHAAILQNTHFIAVSSSVEEFQTLGEVMARVYPDGAVDYHALVSEATEHAKEERVRLSGRRSGFLW